MGKLRFIQRAESWPDIVGVAFDMGLEVRKLAEAGDYYQTWEDVRGFKTKGLGNRIVPEGSIQIEISPNNMPLFWKNLEKAKSSRKIDG